MLEMLLSRVYCTSAVSQGSVKLKVLTSELSLRHISVASGGFEVGMWGRKLSFLGFVSANLLVCRQCSSLLKNTATTSFNKSAGRLLVRLKVS